MVVSTVARVQLHHLGGASLCGVYMFSLCFRGFSLVFSHTPKNAIIGVMDDLKLPM